MDQAFAEIEYERTKAEDDLKNSLASRNDAENARRIREENARLDRYEALQIEAVTSGRKNAAVEMKWAELLTEDIPQELAEQLRVQKEACQAIIDAKDRRIREFQTELKNKHEEYIKTLKAQGLDTTDIVSKMREQQSKIAELYDQQRTVIEQAALAGRQALLAKNKQEVDALFERRRQMEETEFLEQRQEREARFQQRIEELRTQDADDFNKSKIALERSIQELEQHLEKMMATYQLNKEKLDYNLQVLLERNKEHSAIQASYKNRLNRLRETRNNLVARFNKLDQKYKQENADLTEEYRRLTRQYKDLQEKFHHFEMADEKKFRDVWAMNEDEVRKLITKVLEADRLIHEQILGLEWSPPKEDQLLAEMETFSEAGTTTGKSTVKESEGEASGGSGHTGSGKFAPSKVKKVLDLICEEAQFLLDQKVRDQISDLPTDDQKSVVEVDALLRYIGVESQDDVDLLVGTFFQGQDEDDETLYVDADDVLKLLKDFIQEKENLRIADVAPDKQNQKKAKRESVGNESEADRKARRRREERRFWERMGHVLPDMNFRVWKALVPTVVKGDAKGALTRYHELLKRRSRSIDACMDLQKQNEELKQLLDQYLSSKVNEELQVPPTHVIRVPVNREEIPAMVTPQTN